MAGKKRKTSFGKEGAESIRNNFCVVSGRRPRAKRMRQGNFLGNKGVTKVTCREKLLAGAKTWGGALCDKESTAVAKKNKKRTLRAPIENRLVKEWG